MQGCSDSVLEGWCPLKFSSNPSLTHLGDLIKLLLGILSFAGVLKQVRAKFGVWTPLL